MRSSRHQPSCSIAEGGSDAGAGTQHPDKQSRAGPGAATTASQKSADPRQVHRAEAGLKSSWELRSAMPGQHWCGTRQAQAYQRWQKSELKCSIRAFSVSESVSRDIGSVLDVYYEARKRFLKKSIQRKQVRKTCLNLLRLSKS